MRTSVTLPALAGLVALALALAAGATGCRTLGHDAGAAPRPRPAGEPPWVARARAVILEADADGSGDVSAAEVPALGCSLIAALDGELRHDADTTLGVTFGVEPGLIWRGHLLGLAPDAREPLAALLGACLGEPAVPRRDAITLRDLLAIDEPPTSGAWEQEVRRILLAGYDEDGSGEIDRVEVERLPCEVWRHLESAALAGRDRPLLVAYGVSEGYLWVGAMLGLELSSRTTAARSAIACGLAAD